MTPFENGSRRIGALTVEHAEDRVAIYGNLDIERSQQGLVLARSLMTELKAIVADLEANGEALPRMLAPPTSGRIQNPFC